MRYRLGLITRWQDNPEKYQQAIFAKLLKRLQRTAYGDRVHSSTILSYKDFQKYIPCTTYEAIVEEVEKMQQGQRDRLVPGKVKWFAKSSGTTSTRSKYIPTPALFLHENHLKGARDGLALYIAKNLTTTLHHGKAIGVTGSLEYVSRSVIRGDISAILVANTPWFLKPLSIIPKHIALLANWQEKAGHIARIASKKDVRALAGAPTWMMVIIEEVLKYTGKRTIKEVWPNLEVFFHGAVAFGPYRSFFEAQCPSGMHYVNVYNGTEGIFAIQDKDAVNDEMLLLCNHGVFYECIPAPFTKDQQAIPLHEAKEDTEYALVISTLGGLTRYIVGDTIVITSRSPYRIRITGRTSFYINAFGEEVVATNVLDALTQVCNMHNAQVRHFTVAPEYMQGGSAGRHEWLIEFIKEPIDHGLFVQELDSELRKVNSDYDAKRTNDAILLLPRIRIVKEGVFIQWLNSKGKLGGQHKVPILQNNRTLIEEIYPYIDL